MAKQLLRRRSEAREGAWDQSSGGRVGHASGDESRLLSRLLARDEAAFAALINRFHGSMMRVARLFVADLDTAEEVVQETWLAVVNGLSSFQGRSGVKTWIFRILANRAKTRGQREARSISFSALDVAPEQMAASPSGGRRFNSAGAWNDPPRPWSVDTPEDILQRKEALELIERAIATLPLNQRAVIALHDIEGLTSREVRSVLGISETNERVLLHRARSAIRRALEAHFNRE